MKKLLAIVISMAMIVAMMPMGVFATNEELTNYVTVDGIAGMNGQKYATISDAYNAGKNILSNATENDALGQGPLNDAAFDAIFTNGGDITWTVYGTQDFDETSQSYLLTFGRSAKHYSTERHIGTITLKGGNNDKSKDIVNFKTNATLNYEWWGEKTQPDIIVVNNITANVQTSDKLLRFQQAYNEGINLTINECIINGGGIYFYNNQPNDITFTNNTFNGVSGVQNALFIQGHETEITKATIIGNTISGYDRAMNLNQDTGVFIVKDNTITPGTGYSAIQVSSCSSATIENNKIILNDKTNVLTIHESFAKRNLAATINVNNNNISVVDGAKAYFVYDDVNANGKQYGENSANVTLNCGKNNISGSIDITKGIKGETEYAVSDYIKEAIKDAITVPVTPSGPYVPPTDNVTNDTTDKKTTADLTPAVSDNKSTTTVDNATADKIVDKAVANKSTEVIVDAKGNNTVASSEVAIPEKTVKEISEKTDANLVIKTDNGKVDLDKTALAAVAEQAGTDGTVKLVVETVKTDENICHVDLKLITSNGAVKDFRGGNVKVTINLTKELAAKELVCVYIDDNGIYTLVEGVLNADGTYTFTTGHFSEYAVMAKAEADKKIAEQLDTMIKDVNLKVRTSKTAKKNIKAVVSGDVKALTDAGYTVKYKFYRSEKKASKYVSKGEKTADTYINTAGKKGTKYYYKAKAMVYSGDTLVGQTVLKQCKYGVRTWSK